jgi:UDP-N-acetyl-2-amino-2-deoxyglucuronate dehydrogenase
MKIALIGCGRISKNHFESIKHFPTQLELVGVCDILEERAMAAASEYITKPYTNYEKMLTETKPDIVSICTPSGLHPEHAITALNKGMHVISEKPMGVNLEMADAMIQAADDNHVNLFVVKQNRLNTTMQLLKAAIDKGRFGKIYMVQSNVYWTRPQSYYDMSPWRGTWALDGGAFLNQASHYVDALTWLMGDVESVMAEMRTLERKIEAEDTGTALINFKNGGVGTMSVTMLTYPKNFEGSITVLGAKGTVKIGGVAINKIEKWDFEDYDDSDRMINSVNYEPVNVYGYGHIPYYENVLKRMSGDSDAPFTDGRSGRKSLELVLAMYESSRTGQRVTLPLKKD